MSSRMRAFQKRHDDEKQQVYRFTDRGRQLLLDLNASLGACPDCRETGRIFVSPGTAGLRDREPDGFMPAACPHCGNVELAPLPPLPEGYTQETIAVLLGAQDVMAEAIAKKDAS